MRLATRPPLTLVNTQTGFKGAKLIDTVTSDIVFHPHAAGGGHGMLGSDVGALIFRRQLQPQLEAF